MFLKPDFPALSGVCTAFGAVCAALALPGVIRPNAARRAWNAFPRSVWPGRIMAAIALAWAAAWAPTFLVEFVPSIAPKLFVYLQWALVAMIAATCWALPDLLSCRAAGMLLVLVPTPMLSAAQWHPSALRYIVIATAYVMAVSGMFAIARPWLLRDTIFAANASEKRTRAFSIAFLTLGVVFLLCAAIAFPVAPGAQPLR